MPYRKVRNSIVFRIGLEQGLEWNFADRGTTGWIRCMLATCMLRLRAFDDTDIVAAAHDDPAMTELVRAEKQRRKEIELESVEYSRARCLVKQDYVACPEISADFREPQSPWPG